MGTLYILTSPAGKSYIGISSKTTELRWAKHVEHALGKRNSGALYAALRKYGPDSFLVRTLVVSNDWEYLCALEIRAIAAFRTRTPHGYNISTGGEGNTGERDDEFRLKVSVAQRKRFERPEERERMREISRSISSEARERGKKKLADVMRSPEFRARASEATKRQMANPAMRVKLSEAVRASLTEESRAQASVRAKALMADPDMRAKIAKATQIGMKKPETVEKVKATAARRAADPLWRERVSAAKKGVKLGPMQGEHKEKIAAARRREWTDPEIRKLRLAATAKMREVKAHRKLQSAKPFLRASFKAYANAQAKLQETRDSDGRYKLTLIHRIAGSAERYKP